ncbi:hypothetical protein [Yoonia sp.]|uniref:hypothetical protein n=1 Tax=Yoonia sp. TaxID=2212373 RepID=UPI002E05F278|nr:hypothetical protein [Yoonia sp.]
MSNYDQEFVEGMQLKLRLNREALKASEVSALPNAQSAPSGDFRSDLIDQILADKPGLTREKLDQAMQEMGF